MMLRFFKGAPTEHIIRYSAGRISNEGTGLAFYYLPYKTQIAVIPTSSTDANFVFSERTRNFQDVTIQGEFTYRVSDPKKIAALLNLAVDLDTRTYVTNDLERIPMRIRNVLQTEVRSEVQERSLERVLGEASTMAAAVLARIQETRLLEPMGVDLLSVYILSAAPTPEVARALEAEYREGLLRKADEATYARRAAAVEEERTIKEKELSTEITLEQQRRELVDLEGGNAQQEADYRGKALEQESGYKARALEMELAPYRSTDPRVLLALAIQELGRNAAKVGNLTITSEILAELMQVSAPRREGK